MSHSSFLSLPIPLWPDVDRRRWVLAQGPTEFLSAPNPASQWSLARRDIVAESYGQWLQFLSSRGELDPSCNPAHRVTEDRLRAFVHELAERVSKTSVAMMIGAIKRMLDALEPGWDSKLLATLYRNLKKAAAPSRDKMSRMVPASQLYELGLDLMETCGKGGHEVYVATRFRDGLTIALLISCPVRLKNLAMIRIGQHLRLEGERFELRFAAEETKTGRPYHAGLPVELTPYIERYLHLHRPCLMAVASRDPDTTTSVGDAFWIGCRGRPLSDKGLRTQIKLRTEEAYGAAIWPHLFRDCAVTELVDLAPDQIALAPDLLGHGTIQTTQKHYIQAKGMQAHREVQARLAEARNEARRRQRRSGGQT